ncbi:MAG: hypothetical protein ACSHX0_13530 [Akkermansiaceae bacterium]
MNLPPLCKLFSVCTFILTGISAQADILVGYDFDDGIGNGTLKATFTHPHLISTDFEVGAGLLAIVDSSFAPTDGLDAEGNVFGTTNAFSIGGTQIDFDFTDMNDAASLTDSISSDDYLTFTVEPDPYHILNLTSLTFRTFVTELDNAAEHWALFSSASGFSEGDQIASGQTTDVFSWDEVTNNIIIDLTDTTFQRLDESIEFRLYIYGGNEDTDSETVFDKIVLHGSTGDARLLYKDSFDNDGLSTNTALGGGMINNTIQGHSWTDDGDATFTTTATNFRRRAILYTENAFQSDTGFELTVHYTTGSIGNLAAHNFSFGLISTDTDLSTYSGYNPFKADTSVYSIGANITADDSTATQGLNYTDGTSSTTLDQSGTYAQFKAGETCKVTLEIGLGGYWCYRIDDVYEASGILLEGFDLTKNYHIVLYGQDDQGGGKSVQSIQLLKGYASGERAAGMRGSWNGGQGDVDNMTNLKTVDSTIARLNEGASGSGTHNAPHKLLESIALGETEVGGDEIASPVPTWGDLSLDEPESDPFLEEILGIRNTGIGVKIYSNSENFVGNNNVDLETFYLRWKEYCDTNAEVQAFINSQPFHTGVWNSTTQQYEDSSATYPKRPYMFCYAEYVLKEYSLRYGQYASSWTFDSANDMALNGDNFSSGVIEEQRIFQAFANAVHAGGPDVPIAFNNGRSTLNYSSYPFAVATRFDDFTFGHAFGGNNDHASKTGTQFNLNYQHITRMTETNGYVHNDGTRDWDDLIVGNFHSKLGPISWQYSTPSAWEQVDFNQWNLEAMQAGGHTTWEGSVSRGPRTLRDWAIIQLESLDDHLAEFQRPGPPSWARKYTWLPNAQRNATYSHTLVEGTDFWDPEGDEITAVWFTDDAPSWLSISESPANSGLWVMSGNPTEVIDKEYTFEIYAQDSHGLPGSREVSLNVNIVDELSAYEIWSGFHFGSSDSSDSTFDTQDTDGDSLPNLLEFAFGTDPNINDSKALLVDEVNGTFVPGMPVMTITESPLQVTARFMRRVDHDAEGVTYTVQFSEDLDLWQELNGIGATRISGTSAVNDYEAVELNYPDTLLDGNKKLFYRVKVDLTAP